MLRRQRSKKKRRCYRMEDIHLPAEVDIYIQAQAMRKQGWWDRYGKWHEPHREFIRDGNYGNEPTEVGDSNP